MMIIVRGHYLLLAGLLIIFCPMAKADIPMALIAQYQQAASGDKQLVEPVYKQFKQLLEQQNNKPLMWVYFGSTGTLRGRDAWMPWNRFSYTEQGLDNIQRGINKLHEQPLSVTQQKLIQGIPEYYLAKALAATTFTSVPKFFNRFERGYDLFIDLLSNTEFLALEFNASAWIYERAVVAALKADSVPQARLWLAIMLKRQVDHPLTQAALALVRQAEA
ncbi:MAG: hypothetical protein QGG88_06085 [Gammaproteobacteria bacterium]|jgi:hypothetical protein|nr:hypothetical protein [Gammaproteobacteria bacterium]